MAVVLLCALSACSTKSAEPTAQVAIDLPPLDSSLASCDGPAPVDFGRARNGIMPAKALVDGWAVDRSRLAACTRKHKVVVGFYNDLRTELAPPALDRK